MKGITISLILFMMIFCFSGCKRKAIEEQMNDCAVVYFIDGTIETYRGKYVFIDTVGGGGVNGFLAGGGGGADRLYKIYYTFPEGHPKYRWSGYNIYIPIKDVKMITEECN